MKYLLLVALLLIPSAALVAQEEAKADSVFGWNNEVVGSLNLAQTNFDNWSQGGENSLSWQLNVNAKSVNDRENYNWSNAGKISFGAVKVGDQETKKSVDEIKNGIHAELGEFAKWPRERAIPNTAEQVHRELSAR